MYILKIGGGQGHYICIIHDRPSMSSTPVHSIVTVKKYNVKVDHQNHKTMVYSKN